MDHDCMDNLLYVYALCSVLLFIKMFAISCYQGFYRIKNKAFKNIESICKKMNRSELDKYIK